MINDPLKIYNDPRLYAIAKQITLDAGFPYTDPRTLETTQPTTMKNNKKPKWILLDQIHVDVSITTDLPAKDRKQVMNVLRSKSFDKAIVDVIKAALPDLKSIKIGIER